MLLGAALAGAAAGQVPADAPPPPVAPAAEPLVAVVKLEYEIDVRTAALTRRAINRALEQKAAIVLLEINTPGGSVDYLREIVADIQRAQASGARTVAYVTAWAKSAGALIALACDDIYMAPGATIGSAMPIVPGKELGDAEREKYVAAIKSDFRAQAERTGRSAALAEAMVDLDVELLEIEVAGVRRLISRVELDRLIADAAAHGRPDEVVQLGIVKPAGKLLDITVREAVQWGVARAEAATRERVLDQILPGSRRVAEFAPTWSEHLAAWLTNPAVKGLLFLVGLVSLYVEFKAPGLSIPGLIGVACFALFFFGHLTVGLADAWEVLIFALGLGLLAVEIFVLPGFGVAGVLGILLMIAGLVLAQVPFVWPSGDFAASQWVMLVRTTGQTSLALMLGVGGMVGAAVLLPRTPLGKRLMLRAPAVEAGQHGSAAPSAAEEWVGKSGVAETDLRPAGRVRIGDARLDVITEGGWCDAGAAIEVVGTRGNALLVRPLRGVPAPPAGPTA